MSANKKQWDEAAQKQLKGKAVDSLDWETPEHIEVKPLYTEEDIEKLETENTYPGLAPFVRGPYPTMYAGRP